jgi:hypothetical protein
MGNLPENRRPIIKAVDDPSNNPRLVLVSDALAAQIDAFSNGYDPIGYSSFFGPANFDDALATEFGKTIGAEVITVFKSEKDRIVQQVPTIIPIVTTTNSTYGSSSSVTSVGSSTAVGVDRYNYEAYYWYKSRAPIVFGARVRDLTSEERKAAGSNRGLKVFAVVRGSPAFTADVLLDDVLLRIGEVETNIGEDYQAALAKYNGMEVSFALRRGDEFIEGTARFNKVDPEELKN